jgi:putative DNA modification/repair radical SAM protein
MDVAEKLEVLGGAAKYDASCASSGVRRSHAGGLGNTIPAGICHSFTPDGRCVSLLKILYTNHCIFDCHYCVNRRSSPIRRARFSAADVVRLTLEFYRRNYIEGLFLSSGILRSPDYTMEQLAEVARQLRQQHGFRGYIHLKAIPHCSRELLAVAGRWADRLSINIELPTPADLAQLAPDKCGAQIEASMQEVCGRVQAARAAVRESPRAVPFAPAGQSTQMIIGATPSSDAAILTTAARLYHQHQLRRVYYSAFSPVPHADAHLPAAPPPLVREHRLYQADWLLRYYGFHVEELVGPDAPQLDLDMDPKQAWALRHRDRFPVDVNRAEREELLRVPGLGVRNVQRLLTLRRHQAIRLQDLRRLRVVLRRAQPFLITADHNAALAQLDGMELTQPMQPRQRQLLLFETRRSAVSGEL